MNHSTWTDASNTDESDSGWKPDRYPMNTTGLASRFDTLDRPTRLLVVAWVLATGASLGTLVLSEIMGFPPCELCWYQRGLLYPQVFIVGAALLVPAFRVAALAIPLSVAGIGVASYHSWLQLQPAPSETCTLSNPCSEVTLEVAGLSIPNLSLVTFSAVLVLLLVAVGLRWGLLGPR